MLTIVNFSLKLYKMFIISIETGFSAAHSIKGYKGDCSHIHGHNYRVEVNIQSDYLNKIGMSLDFRELKRISKKAVGSLDHKNLNDIEFFRKNNPTAENIAKFLYQIIKRELKGKVSLYSVKVWETDEYAVTYKELTD